MFFDITIRNPDALQKKDARVEKSLEIISEILQEGEPRISRIDTDKEKRETKEFNRPLAFRHADSVRG